MFHPTTRMREYRQNQLGRFRWYTCKVCGERYRVFTLEPLPKERRICDVCQANGYIPDGEHIVTDGTGTYRITVQNYQIIKIETINGTVPALPVQDISSVSSPVSNGEVTASTSAGSVQSIEVNDEK